MCTALGKTYFTQTSSKYRVMTAKIFEFFAWLTWSPWTQNLENMIRFSPFLHNQDDNRHAALCTALGKTYLTKKSSKHRVVTATIFEIFTL